MQNKLQHLENIKEILARLRREYGICHIDEELYNELSELSVYLNVDLYAWFLDFLDQEKINAPASRIFLLHFQHIDNPSILKVVQLLHVLDQEVQEDAIGLKLASYVLAKYGGVLGNLCLSSENLGEVFARFQRYYQLMFEGFRMQVYINDKHILISWDLIKKMSEVFGSRRIGRVFVDLCVASLFTIVSRLFNHQYSVYSNVCLMGQEPVDPLFYQRFFRCLVSFNADFPSVTIPLTMLSPLINIDSEKLKLLVKVRLQAEMSRHPALMSDRFLLDLEQVLLCALNDNRPNINYVSEKMAISRANLQRKLQERDLTFSELLDKTRLNMAKIYLEDKSLPMTEIAWLLAFSDQTAFSRSFKRWTGITPFEFRQITTK
jgi:AraC-like DNA-binding protein